MCCIVCPCTDPRVLPIHTVIVGSVRCLLAREGLTDMCVSVRVFMLLYESASEPSELSSRSVRPLSACFVCSAADGHRDYTICAAGMVSVQLHESK